MKQQIVISGIGGQGVLFLTRVIAQVAVARGLPVLTSETHGMAQRGGTVLSTIKVGAFASPLIRAGQGDIGLILWEGNLEVHRGLLKDQGQLFVSAEKAGDGERVDAAGIARDLGSAVLANLVLLGLAVRRQALFCSVEECEAAIRLLAPAKFVEGNLEAFRQGLASGKS